MLPRFLVVLILSISCVMGYGQEKKITNSIGMTFVRIPNGRFTMGAPQDEPGRQVDEPVHAVTISQDFFLGTTEVTQAHYEKVMRRNPSYFQGENVFDDSSKRPVEQVTWNDAVEFCKRLSELPEEKKSGRVYRLPTETEWEYACRAGKQTAYSFANDPKFLDDYAWFRGNSNNQTQLVGKKKPNDWGLHDMHGNVWEWCSDWLGDYPKDPSTDPTGPNEGSRRSGRGGCWMDMAEQCRSASRGGNNPSLSYSGLGFRVALSLPDEKK